MLAIDDKARITVLKGYCSEDFVRWKLMEDGYNVVKTVRKGRDKKTGFKTYNYLNIQFIERAILKDWKGDKEAFIKLLKENISGLPDFVCFKDGEIIFVEVKTKNSSLRLEQQREFDYLNKLGFRVLVYEVDMDIKINDIVAKENKEYQKMKEDLREAYKNEKSVP